MTFGKGLAPFLTMAELEQTAKELDITNINKIGGGHERHQDFGQGESKLKMYALPYS